MGFWAAAAFQWVNPKAWLVCAGAVGTYVQADAGTAFGQSVALALLFIAAALPSCFVWLAAGASVQLLAKEAGYAQLRMPSGEIRRVDASCRATVGEVGNAEQGNIKLGKAGRNRWKGKRPTVRGVAMNPVDHPLGGGEGKSSGGRHPVSPWGKPEGRTRRAHKPSDRLISRRRGRNKR